jgi:hypothetical protein
MFAAMRRASSLVSSFAAETDLAVVSSGPNAGPRLIVHKGFSNFALKLLLDLLKLGLYPVNYLAPPSKRCLKFMAPAVKKIEFLLIGHVFPVYIYIVVPVLSTSSPLLSHGEISRFVKSSQRF